VNASSAGDDRKRPDPANLCGQRTSAPCGARPEGDATPPIDISTDLRESSQRRRAADEDHDGSS